MPISLIDIARLVEGEVVGDGSLEIKSAASIEDASPSSLIFILEDKNAAAALASKAVAVVAKKKTILKGKPGILVDNPRLAMAKILALFQIKPGSKTEVHPTAIIAKSAKIGDNPFVGAFCVIGENCKIGDNVKIFPHAVIGDNVFIGSNVVIRSNASIYENVTIGNNVIIHSGAVIGVDGYGFVPQKSGLIKIPQIGTVVIEDDVEIYANACVARGALGATIIGKGTKIDNLTHVAHNCVFGENCAITALVGFAGSVTFGKNVQVGGQAGFNGHITVGDNTVVMAKAGVTKDIPSNSIISGFPAQPHAEELKMQAALRKLIK